MDKEQLNSSAQIKSDIITQVVQEPSRGMLIQLGAAIRNGKLVAIPTETVYGLGANGLDPEAMDRIYAAKGRPSDNPLILHVPDAESIKPLVLEVTKTAQKLMDAFWPGPLTITLPKSDLVPDRATGGLPRVALRCPDHAICHELLVAVGVPVAAPSANISGRPSPTTAEDVYHDMNGRIEYILDDGPCTIGVESTVVEVHDDAVTILRPGGITKEMLETVVAHVDYDPNLVTGKTVPKAPGMKYKHYAPDSPMITFVGDDRNVAEAIKQSLIESDTSLLDTQTKHSIRTVQSKIGLLLSQEVFELLGSDITDDKQYYCIVYGSSLDYVALAHSFYKSLLLFNEAGVTRILAQGVLSDGIGVAIMNRMEKASNKHVIYV